MKLIQVIKIILLGDIIFTIFHYFIIFPNPHFNCQKQKPVNKNKNQWNYNSRNKIILLSHYYFQVTVKRLDF